MIEKFDVLLICVRFQRDLDVRSQLEALTSRMSGRVKNVTCVMQELGYLDDNLEPNYLKISERINNLPVSEELRKDMLDGIQFCQQFSVRTQKSQSNVDLAYVKSFSQDFLF